MEETVTIARRFRGPPESGNGGYSCGIAAAFLDGPAEVTLRKPPPLDTPLRVERGAQGVTLFDQADVVAEAKAAALDIAPPAPPSWAEAVEASSRYPWRETHPYPSCFVCGSQRTAGDGLCVWPGKVAGRDLAAAPFAPAADLYGADGLLRPEIVWASLDCPSWYGYFTVHPFDSKVLLGRLAARIDSRPRAGERCICVGWFLAREGRKVHCGSALYSESGALHATGKATWIVLK